MTLVEWWEQATADQRNEMVAEKVMGWEMYASDYNYVGWAMGRLITNWRATTDAYPGQNLRYFNPQRDVETAWFIFKEMNRLGDQEKAAFFEAIYFYATGKKSPLNNMVHLYGLLTALSRDTCKVICLAALEAHGITEI